MCSLNRTNYILCSFVIFSELAGFLFLSVVYLLPLHRRKYCFNTRKPAQKVVHVSQSVQCVTSRELSKIDGGEFVAEIN